MRERHMGLWGAVEAASDRAQPAVGPAVPTRRGASGTAAPAHGLANAPGDYTAETRPVVSFS
jgi:hypothetical protein